MQQEPYPYRYIKDGNYEFISDGTHKIHKGVTFTFTGVGSYINLGFGDSRSDGRLDDRIVSNNGDIQKVIYTVIEIIKEYTQINPQAEIYFRGSSPERTRLYRRIIKMYYARFNKEFTITGFLKTRSHTKTDLYDPQKSDDYFAFAVKRIS